MANIRPQNRSVRVAEIYASSVLALDRSAVQATAKPANSDISDVPVD